MTIDDDKYNDKTEGYQIVKRWLYHAGILTFLFWGYFTETNVWDYEACCWQWNEVTTLHML